MTEKIGRCQCFMQGFKRRIMNSLESERAEYALYAESMRLRMKDGKHKSDEVMSLHSGTGMTYGDYMRINTALAEEIEDFIEEVEAIPDCDLREELPRRSSDQYGDIEPREELPRRSSDQY